MNGPVKMNDADEFVETLELCWKGVVGWVERNVYSVDRSRRIPF